MSRSSHEQALKRRFRWVALALAIAAPFGLPGGPAAADTVDELVSALEGGWTGVENDTPFGKMPFTVLFEWTEEGDLHSRSHLNRDTYIDLRFSRDAEGRWILHEEAAMEGLGAQKHSLSPAEAVNADGSHTWVWEQDPEFLSIHVGLDQATMNLDVVLRGRPHASFRLDRLPREAWAELKREMLAQATLSPAEGVSIAEVVSDPPAGLADDDPIAAARRAVTRSPGAAEAHMALARVIGRAINEDPANGPRYAFEMLTSLQKAVELDRELSEAYHYLVGYYLNAPPIAGGSVERAESTARALAEFDPAGSETLMIQIETHRQRLGGGGAN